jgi:hypothetical protein
MRTRPVAITDLPPSPEQDQRSRMGKYALTMGIRMVCIIACLFTPGWWLLIPALGAVFLPYVAVVVANATSRRARPPVARPGGIVPFDSDPRQGRE